MSLPSRSGFPAGRARSGGALLKAIFNAPSPEEYIRRLPAQSLFIAIKQAGLESSAEVVEVASLEQCRLLMDFDCWRGDSFCEENFWEWLALCDAGDGLDLLYKLLKFVDYKLAALMVGRYVHSWVSDQPSDPPPDAGYYTPDHGRTWIKINVEDPRRHFLLARFLAALFERDADAFYQLLSVPNVATPAMLEEEAYQEKQKRLAAEGLPDDEYAFELCRPVAIDQALRALKESGVRPAFDLVAVIEPLLYQPQAIQPLSDLAERVGDDFGAEFTLLVNAALVRWRFDLSSAEEALRAAAQVRGALNIGLTKLISASQAPALEIYQACGLRALFGCGLESLTALRKAALAADEKLWRGIEPAAAQAAAEALREPLPRRPAFLDENGRLLRREDGSLDPTLRPIETLNQVEMLLRFIRGENAAL